MLVLCGSDDSGLGDVGGVGLGGLGDVSAGGGGLSGLIGEYNYLHSFLWHRDSPAHNAPLHFFPPRLGLHKQF